MKRISATVLIIGLSFLTCSMVACNNGQSNGDKGNFATATITGTMPDTAVSGMATFAGSGKMVKMNVSLYIPSKANQSVAVHIHENGNCGDTGKAAGAHWNPSNSPHGKWESDGFHAGDIGNINLDASGKGNMELETDRWSIEGVPGTDIVNKTVVVHAGTDDYTSQPGGNAGSRIGCGIITKTER